MDVTSIHTIYMILGGYITVFSLCSLFIKEKLYIGEATVASIIGIIVGPHCLGWFDPTTWGNTDYITLEISRIILIVQVFAVGVELPKKYMLRHWRSVAFLLVPVMSFGWVISGVIIWGLTPTLSFIEGLTISACITATDPVLASSVVGKGTFAKRVPGHLRNLLSAESGCNDGMAFPFIYLSLSLLKYLHDPGELFLHWLVLTVLYECIFGCILGSVIGWAARHTIKYSEQKGLIDRESFLVFYFVLALFSCGVGVTLGTDDLLVAFSAGASFAWDGWFTAKTEESHVSNVIDLLLNLAYFVYFGAIIPWETYSNADWGLSPWRLVVVAILIILFRRIPAVLLCKPLIPDIKNWREAFFCGHFGPIGVGALFVAILARGELEHNEPTPLAELPPPGSTNLLIIEVIWPIVTFLVVCSIVVHGSSIAVFTLGKRINTVTFTMSFTREVDGPNWLNRLPRLEMGHSVSIGKKDADSSLNGMDGPITKPPPARARRFLSIRSQTGGSQENGNEGMRSAGVTDEQARSDAKETEEDYEEKTNDGKEAFQEGDNLILEDESGEVISQMKSPAQGLPADSDAGPSSVRPGALSDQVIRQNRRKGNVYAYEIGNTVIWENEEGEIIKRYNIPKVESRSVPTYQRMKVWFRNKNPQETQTTSPDERESLRQNEPVKSVEDTSTNRQWGVVGLRDDVDQATDQRSTNKHVHDDREDETAAERHRREAALGLRDNVEKESERDPTEDEKRFKHSGLSNPGPHLPSISFAQAPTIERGERNAESRRGSIVRRHSPRPSLSWGDDVQG